MALSCRYVVIVDVRLKASVSKADAKELLVQNATASFRNEPGCHRFDVIETCDSEVPFVLYEIYQDESAFEEHLKSKHYQEFDTISERFFDGKAIRSGGLIAAASEPPRTAGSG